MEWECRGLGEAEAVIVQALVGDLERIGAMPWMDDGCCVLGCYGERGVGVNWIRLIGDERGSDMIGWIEPRSIELEPNASWLILLCIRPRIL